MFEGKRRQAWFLGTQLHKRTQERGLSHFETLVIIDMQPESFRAAGDRRTIEKVVWEIKRVMSVDGFIVIVYCKGEGDIAPEIFDALGEYPYTLVEKSENDGSVEIITECARQSVPLAITRVCGVNIHSCVQETVSGLSALLPHAAIEVVMNACNSATLFAWEAFVTGENVTLV